MAKIDRLNQVIIESKQTRQQEHNKKMEYYDEISNILKRETERKD